MYVKCLFRLYSIGWHFGGTHREMGGLSWRWLLLPRTAFTIQKKKKVLSSAHPFHLRWEKLASGKGSFAKMASVCSDRLGIVGWRCRGGQGCVTGLFVKHDWSQTESVTSLCESRLSSAASFHTSLAPLSPSPLLLASGEMLGEGDHASGLPTGSAHGSPISGSQKMPI